MNNIDEFARRAAGRFRHRQQSSTTDFQLGLSQDAVETFIKTCFYASLIPDETRFPSVTLICYKKGSETDFHFLFLPERDLSATEIAKLSHSVGYDSHLCCIANSGKLTLGGLHITVLNDRRDLGYSSFRTANPLKVCIRGPGYIEVSAGDMAMVYKAGKITEDVLLQESHIIRDLASTVSKRLQPDKQSSEPIHDLFNDLAKFIIRLGHGGMILIADSYRSCISSCRKVDYILLQHLLLRYWDSVDQLLASSREIDKLLDSPIRTGNKNSWIVAATTEMLEKSVRSIAQLAGLDGAIIMDYDCRVVAFNAIINRAVADVKRFTFIDGTGTVRSYEEVIKDRGSRHQSALSFVMRVPNSVALVISQDASVSALSHHSERIIASELAMRVLE
jgi:hypothetical protein